MQTIVMWFMVYCRLHYLGVSPLVYFGVPNVAVEKESFQIVELLYALS